MKRMYMILIGGLILMSTVSGCSKQVIQSKEDAKAVQEQVENFAPVKIAYDKSILDENEKLAEYESDNEDSTTDESNGDMDSSVASTNSDDDNVTNTTTNNAAVA